MSITNEANELIVGSPTFLYALAEVLDTSDETTLGPTDSHYAAVALRLYAAFLDASMP